MLAIGMFGTCGGSTWREKFIEKYEEQGMNYFNPQVENWTPECAVDEARHLAEDKIILFPVTQDAETPGLYRYQALILGSFRPSTPLYQVLRCYN